MKYIEIVPQDSSADEISNVKHLYGATLLCLRAHPDNAALQLLQTYCITFLGAGSNETLKANACGNFIEAFMSMYKKEGSKVWEYIDRFNGYLADKVQDEFIKENVINNGKKAITLFIQDEIIDNLTDNYTKEDDGEEPESKG